VHTALRLSVHDIDLVIWLSRARVTRVAAAGHTLPGEGRPRSLVALLRMNSGASAVVETHYVLPPAFPSNTLPPEAPGSRVGVIEAFGTEGMGRLDDLGGPSLWNRDGVYSPDVFVTPRTGERIGGAMRAELEHFVSCAATGTPSDLAPLGDSVHATAVAEAIIRAEQSGAVEQVEETP
jgi:predicted dehydrogenase